LKPIGTPWIESGASLLLSVPAAINDQERNYLVNPQHPQIAELQIVQTRPFQFDPRMFRR